jgi:hypothetical protein
MNEDYIKSLKDARTQIREIQETQSKLIREVINDVLLPIERKCDHKNPDGTMAGPVGMLRQCSICSRDM